MKPRDISLIAMYSAMLVAIQFALSFVAGVELVSVGLLVFSVVFGGKRGVATAVVFSLLRCIIWSVVPTAMILYIIYFPLYALIVSLCGKIKEKYKYVVLVFVAGVMTVCFTLLDDVVTPLILGYSAGAWRVYFIASLPVLATHTACVVISVAILYPPLYKLMSKLKIRYFNDDDTIKETTSL